MRELLLMISPQLYHALLASLSTYLFSLIQSLLQGEREKLLGMEQILENRVVGQEDAIRAVCDAVR